jgi:hypothetical protein
MWIYDPVEKRARYILPPKKRHRRRKDKGPDINQGSSVTTKKPKSKDLAPEATNRQPPWRYGQKRK